MVKLYPDSLHFYDDLAWALDKVGEHEKAKKVLLKKDSIQPGLYETEANLGTVLIHNGKLKEGLKHIKKAIEINPNAHFGREIYQQYVVEYVLENQDSTGKLSLPLGEIGNNFYSFLYQRSMKDSIQKGSSKEKEISKAIKGVAGMMKFGNYESPVLLEVLGDLLNASKTGEYKGAGHLAARAYAKAGLKFEGAVKEAYVKLAKYSIEHTYVPERFLREGPEGNMIPHQELGSYTYTYKKLERALMIEVQEAEEWFKQINENEVAWIRSGLNPDSAFAANYYDTDISEIKSIDPQYQAGRLELNEAHWKSIQKWSAKDVAYMFADGNLADSLKDELDSIYRLEFQMIPDPLPVDSTDQRKENLKEESIWTSSPAIKWSVIFGAIAAAIGSLILYLRLKSK
jgi:tetratricopeptide (TPR) repeat protein